MLRVPACSNTTALETLSYHLRWKVVGFQGGSALWRTSWYTTGAKDTCLVRLEFGVRDQLIIVPQSPAQSGHHPSSFSYSIRVLMSMEAA